MFGHPAAKATPADQSTIRKTELVNQLIKQRSLQVKQEAVMTEEDLASKLI